MLKGFLHIFLCAVFVLSIQTHSNAADPNSPFKNSNTELAVVLGSLAIGTLFYAVQVNQNNPLLKSDVKPFRSETIPTWSVVAVHLGYAMTPFLIEASDSERHFRGFVFAFTMNYAAWSTVASIVGRKRPNYDDALANNQKAKERSFYSGHATESFSSATYMSLYLKDHIESNSLKVLLPVLMFGYAGYVSKTRVDENFHHFSDVLAGATAGMVITYFSYKFYQNVNRNFEISANRESLNLSYEF